MAESKPEVGGREGKMCQPCLNKDIKRAAEVFCTTCNEFQCNDCANAHTIYAFMKYHTLLSVTEGLSYVDKQLDMKGLDICMKHKQPFEYYCEDDKVLFCHKCAIVGHKRCLNVKEIENIAKDGQCNTLRDQLQQAITTTNQAVENLTEAEASLNTDIESIPKKLSEMDTTIIHAFEQFAGKVTQDANSYRDKTMADWAKSKIECEDNIKNMKLSFETIDTIATNGTPSQQFIAEYAMTETIQGQVKSTDSLCADVQTLNVSFNFDKEYDTLKTNLLSTLTPDELVMKYSIPRKTKLVQISSIDFMQTGDDVGEPLYTGIDFLPDGRLVAVDNTNGKCLLYDENLKMMSAYKLPYMHPQSVVVVSDDEVAITTSSNYSLDFLHVSKSNQITMHKTCTVGVKYGSISMKDDDNFVVGTIDHTPPVRIVSVSGDEKDFDIVFPSKKYSITTSSCTYIRGQNKVVLTDKDADTVYMYDSVPGGKIAIMDKLINSPHGLTVGPNDHVFVGSTSTTQSLVEITPAGRVLSSHQVDMQRPRILAVSKDRRRLAVSNSAVGSRKLKLYKIQSV